MRQDLLQATLFNLQEILPFYHYVHPGNFFLYVAELLDNSIYQVSVSSTAETCAFLRFLAESAKVHV